MSAIEKLRLWLASLLVIIVIYVLGYAELTTPVRFAIAVVSLSAAAALIVFSRLGGMFFRFVRDSGNELRKVVWPDKQEVMQMTGVVFVFLVIVTLFLWVVDLIVSFLLGQLV